MKDRIEIDIKDHVADVHLVRGDKMNALDPLMMDALIEAAAELDGNHDVRSVVISGDGRGFCAGLDMGNFAQMAAGEKQDGDNATNNGALAKRTHGKTNKFQQVVYGWRDLHAPVIAAVHGVALGGGFQLAMGADIRFVHPATRMSILEMKWGLIPDMGATPIIRSLAGDDILRELTYTARMFDGVQAKEYGFATHVTETPYEDAMALAQEIADQNPTAIRAGKVLMNKLHDATVEEAFMTESVLQDEIFGNSNQTEAVRAALEKRKPVFL